MLGWIEMVILGIEIFIAFRVFLKEYTLNVEGHKISIFLSVLLQLLNTVLAILDFSVFTISAQNDAASLFNVTDENTYRDWCVSVSNNSVACINKERGIGGQGELMSSGESIVSGWLVLILVIGTTVALIERRFEACW